MLNIAQKKSKLYETDKKKIKIFVRTEILKKNRIRKRKSNKNRVETFPKFISFAIYTIHRLHS